MNPPNKTTCPPVDTLDAFAHGMLKPPKLDECESHISACPSCLETLRGLGADDTLTGHIAAAMNEPKPAKASDQLDGLLKRMLSLPPKNLNPITSPQRSNVAAELMADRAAEVLRCLEPTDDHSLGSIGDYDLERLIGAGSSGVVFQATDRTLKRSVALKVLRPSLGAMARQRFIAEAQSAASIEHANVVTIYQVGESDRLAFMAMQWIPGQTLEQQLAAGKQFEESQVRTIASQIASGLQAAHKRQIIHRDIKPANIWITETDQSVKILDFGLARISDDDPGLTATGMLAGTPNFMSPEQTKGLELDGRSDLFSLGCLIYRLLTGRLPFGAPTVLATLQAIQNHQPAALSSLRPSVGDDLNDLTMALLEKQPANRPASAQQLVALLESPRPQWPIQINHYVDSAATSQLASSVKKPTASSNGSRIFRWIATTIALAMLGFGGYFLGPQIIRIATDQGEIVIETDDPNVQVEVLKDGKLVRVLDTKTDQSFNIKSGNYEFRASPATAGASDVSFAVTPRRLVMSRGNKQIVKVSKTSAAADANSSTTNAPTTAQRSNKLIYDGKNFEQWIQIAQTDRYPKNVANAIRACGTLAETAEEQKSLFAVIESAAQRHGKLAIGDTSNGDENVMLAALHAIWQHPPELAVDFVKKQLDNGNTRSLHFCTWVIVGGVDSEINPNRHEFDSVFAGRLEKLLPAAMDREQLADHLIRTALNIPTEQLIKLNPETKALAEKAYREQSKIENSPLITSLAKLAAHVQVDDAKVVAHLIDQYNEVQWQPTPTCHQAFSALAFQIPNSHFNSGLGIPYYRPIVNWHDELRADFFTDVLEQESSQAAVERRFSTYTGQELQVLYEAMECLNAMLPKLSTETRNKIKIRLVQVEKNLPSTIKAWLGRGIVNSPTPKRQNDIAHNLKSLIATCDGKNEPAFISIPTAKGSKYPGTGGFGGGGMGGGGMGGGGMGGSGGVF
jgi:anti-sigma factor RsiW